MKMKDKDHMQGLLTIALKLVLYRPHLLLDELFRRLLSKRQFYILYRDLDKPFHSSARDKSLQLRTFQREDLHKLLSLNRNSLSDEEVMDRIRRLCFLKTGIGICYVATTGQDEPCHMQWMITHDYNLQLGTYFNDGIPPFDQDEVLLEFAFTPETYKNKGVWTWATKRIAEEAKKLGKRRLIVFVRSDNPVSLNKCIHKGFVPYRLRKDRWFLFLKKSIFEDLDAQSLYSASR
jgi:hypothetical protein